MTVGYDTTIGWIKVLSITFEIGRFSDISQCESVIPARIEIWINANIHMASTNRVLTIAVRCLIGL